MRATILLVVLAGCESETECRTEGGLWRAELTELEGDCGEFPSAEIAIAEGALPVFGGGPACVADIDTVESGCELTVASTCTLPGGALSVQGTTEFVSETEAEGLTRINVAANAPDEEGRTMCSSRYSIRYTRL